MINFGSAMLMGNAVGASNILAVGDYIHTYQNPGVTLDLFASGSYRLWTLNASGWTAFQTTPYFGATSSYFQPQYSQAINQTAYFYLYFGGYFAIEQGSGTDIRIQFQKGSPDTTIFERKYQLTSTRQLFSASAVFSFDPSVYEYFSIRIATSASGGVRELREGTHATMIRLR